MTNVEKASQFLFYNSEEGNIRVQVILGDETVWVTQKSMAEIFDVDKSGISRHLKNIFDEGELDKESVVAKNATTGDDGKIYQVEFYNLDAIISVGYRVNSQKATSFRIWATRILKEYLVKGFTLDDERLKQGKKLSGKDYFNELVERVREIRASERRFYQKITDIYAQCSIDYDPQSKITRDFFATVQNKLEFAITHHTASEIIKLRANASKPNMGLTSWKNEKQGGKILKSDVSVAKNYLKENELGELNILVNMYLDYAELQAKRNNPMKMKDWVQKLNAFLKFNEYDLLNNAGKVKASVAKKFAESQYEKFRVIQDREFESDFDKLVSRIVNKTALKEDIDGTVVKSSKFNKSLKAGLDYNPKKES